MKHRDDSQKVSKENVAGHGKVKFSFLFFEQNEKFDYPPKNDALAYLKKLFEQLKVISNLTVEEFCSKKHANLHIHPINWEETSEPEGYQSLPDHLQNCQPWQFSITANKHGRVHGFFINETFYIVWIDVDHALYP